MTNYSVTNVDLKSILGPKVKIMRYSKLKNKRSLAHLMSNGVQFLVILYEWKPNYGHWCMIMKTADGGYEFFDPYGTKPDSALKNYPRSVRNEYMNFPYVAKLLRDSGKQIYFNQFKLQDPDDKIKTCGRWLIWRALHQNMTIEQFFKKYFNKIKNKDAKIVKLTRPFLKR